MTNIRFIIILIIAVALSACNATKQGRIAQGAHEIGEYYKAIEKYRQANKKEKDRDKRTQYYYELAECYRAIGEYDLAAMHYKIAIRRNYPDPAALLQNAEMLRASLKYEEALENYRAYLDSVPGAPEALRGIEAMQKTQYWNDHPTRHIVNGIRELNSRESDYMPVFVGGRDNEIIFTSTRKAATGKKEKHDHRTGLC